MTLGVVALGLLLCAAADFWLELPRVARVAGLAGLGCLALWVMWREIVEPLSWWSRPRTAAEIEQRFPQLGQRVRTTVQFAGRPAETVSAEGITPMLVTALEQDTEAQARPLDLESIVPRRMLRATAVIAAAPILFLLTAAVLKWEWRIAVGRALLGEIAYTELAVSPGNTIVEQGEDAAITIDLKGRTDRPVVLYSRSAGQSDSSWVQAELPAKEARTTGDSSAQYNARLAKLTAPTEYRVLAGPARSDVFRIDIRYPLAIESIRVGLEPPEYTGVEPSTIEQGDLDVIDGTKAKFEITLDRPCAEAALVLTDPRDKRTKDEAGPEPQSIPLTIDGTTLGAELQLTEDRVYSIVARSGDGSRLPDNRYRIRVRKDQAPQVSFDEPNEALEVHSLAEVLMRIRVRDDFGLSKAGIVFQANNGEEHTLLLKDFMASEDAPSPLPGRAEEGASDGRPSLTTHASLDKILPLEHFNLTQKDSVTYYAFVEDNLPGAPHRSQTDLRFVDVRPFKRIYKVGGT
jgi:hypothetical protein